MHSVTSRADATIEPSADGSLRVLASCSGSARVMHHPRRAPGFQPVLFATDLAGLAGGDTYTRDIEVRASAKVVISDPAPTHLLPGEDCATSDTTVVVRRDAMVLLLPHAVVPFAGSRTRLHTRVHIDPGGFAFVAGILSPGRVAAGEEWSADSLAQRVDVFCGGSLVLSDALRLDATPNRLPGHLVSAFVSGPGGSLHADAASEVAAEFGAALSQVLEDLVVLRAIVSSQQVAHALLTAVCEVFVEDVRGWDWGRIQYRN